MRSYALHLRLNCNRAMRSSLIMLVLTLNTTFAAKRDAAKEQKNQTSVIDRLLQEPSRSSGGPLSAGSTYVTDGNLADMSTDYRATREGDLLTVVVADQASAAAKGVTSSKRTSSAKASIDSLFGPNRAAGALTNLAQLGGQQQLDGQGTTSRQTNLSTTLSARVLRVLPNGYLIIEGTKLIAVNSEYQTVSLRGIVRPIDIGSDNRILSNEVADLEVRINGRGVVNDAIRRPNFLYRLFLGILPF